MIQVLDKYGNSYSEIGNVVVIDKNGNIKKIQNNITKTSELINDGSDGTSIYVEQDDSLFSSKENIANKATDFLIINDTLYPSVEAVKKQLDSKLDKNTTAGVERVYTINPDGSQATKPTSELGGAVTLPQVKGFAVDFINANNIGSAAEMPNIALASGTADYAKNTNSTFEIGHTGIVALRSSANINSGFSFFKGGVINNGDKHINFTQFKIISNTNTKGYIGFHKTTTTTEPISACFLEVVNGTAVFKTKGVSLTTASSSFSLSENVWYNMLIEFKSTTEVYFKIKTDAGVLVSEFTSTTNLPQFNVSDFSNVITFFSTVATTARDLIWLDYVEFRNERPNYLKSF